MNSHHRLPSQAALRLALVLLFGAGGAAATTVTVSNLADSGPGSLRQAVLDANAAPGADRVAFAPGLTGTITLTSQELAITDSLTVQGPGSGFLTVSGGNQHRIFFIHSPSPSPIAVTLSGLTLTRGAGLPPHELAAGGAVFDLGEDLTIDDCTISDSYSGLLMDPPYEGCGGNVAFDGLEGGGLRIVNSILTGGRTLGLTFPAGGNLCVLRGRFTVERSVLSGGDAAAGGGLYTQDLKAGSSLLLSTVSGNNATSGGGGIYAESTGAGSEVFTIESSTISDNVAGAWTSGGGIHLSRASCQIFNSTLSGNRANLGGGVFQQDGHLLLVDSTVSTNHADFAGGGIHFAEFGEGSLVIRLTTLNGNSSGGGGNLLIASPSPAGAVQLDHAVVANGTPGDVSGFGALPATLTANYSLIENPGTSLLVGGHNLVGVDPLLGPLAENGGPTRTHQLLPGSPALDAGDPAIPSPPATDQRGRTRIEGPAIDLGAVEGIAGLVQVPALSQLGLLVLGASLLAAGLSRLRRGRA